jgi:hypothetical protein
MGIIPWFIYIIRVVSLLYKAKRRVERMSNEFVLHQIEELRRELNEQYKQHSVITPELVELSVKLDHLLNKLNLHP